MNTQVDHNNLELLRALLQIPCPSGREERMAAFICRHITALGFQPELDAQGNVWTQLASRSDSEGPIALASHMDEIAMVVNAIEADGTLRVQRSGGLHPWKLGECPVQLVGDGDNLVPAHLSFGSGHTNDPDDPIAQFASGARGLTWTHCHLLTGLSTAELRAAGVRVGTCAVPISSVRGPHLLGPPDDPLVSAWLLDNRGGTLTLLRLLEKIKEHNFQPARPLYLCFMVQEEGGLLGAKGWAHRHPVETFIAVDSSPIPRGSQLSLDGRPATWSKDSGAHFHQPLIGELASAATRANTELQYAVYGAAASDATGVLQAGLAPRAATIGYPRTNSHGYEVCRLSVFDHLVNTLFSYIEGLA
ncbi:MAG: putative aminopeptidase FrvX [Candidatus Latescibacterota bacterium]|jgi:putative aminopeptidase FrvX